MRSHAYPHTSPTSTHRKSSKRISLREWLVALSGGLTLAFTAWGLGGVEVWTLHVLLVGGLLTLALALLPFPTDFRSPACHGVSKRRRISTLHFPLKSFKRLVCWPFFWCTCLFLIYLLIGALNPAAEIVRDERGWWVEAIQPSLGLWLPISVRSDYEPMNAWRVFVSFTASFALVWGLWAGLTRRKTTLLVLWCLLLSGAGMGMVAILQDLTEAKAVLWTFPSSNENFWGSFFYRNQAGAYLNLVLVAAAFLFFYHAVKTRQYLRSGGPHFLCLFLFCITATSIAMALSRGGILFGSIVGVVFACLLLVYGIQSLFHLRSLVLTALTLLCLAAGGYAIVSFVDFDAIEERFGDVEQTIETADQDARALSTRATWEMAQDRLALGWGAGSFRYLFPMYQRNYPEIYYRKYIVRRDKWIGRRVYRYAHNDIVQFVAEYGFIGSVLLFGGIALLLLQSLYHSSGQVFAVLILLVGATQAFGHAFVDFIFNSPAYWLAFLGLLVAATKLLSLEGSKGGMPSVDR